MAERVLLDNNKRRAKQGEDGGGGDGEKKSRTLRRKLMAAGVEATPLPDGSPLPFEKRKGGGGSAPKEPPFRLVFRAPIVVAAAGSLHTPALLLRSGLKNRNIGRGLRLHPSLVVLGRFPQKEEEEEKKKKKNTGDIEDFGRAGSVCMDKRPIMSAFGKGSADWEGKEGERERETSQRRKISFAQQKNSNLFNNNKKNSLFLTGSGYGSLLMTPSLHLAGFAATVPWRGNAEFKKILSSYGDWSPVLVLTRDGSGRSGGSKGGGRVSLDSQGQPRFDYRPSRSDARAKGVAAAVDALAAAGAVEIGSFLQTPFLSLPPATATATTAATTTDAAAAAAFATSSSERKLAVERYKRRIEKEFGPRAIRSGGSGATIISAHQMGTARAGPSPKAGAVEGRTGESFEVENLFVSDASLFPTASGVNPMISICALSWMVSKGICERKLGRKRAAAAARSVLARASVSLLSPPFPSSPPPPSSSSSCSLSPAAIFKEAVEGGAGLPPSCSCSRANPVVVSRE